MQSAFFLLVVARSLLSFSTQLQATVMAWQIYEITRNPLDLGLLGLFEAIPALSLALFSGRWVDRGNPMSFYRLAFVGSALSVGVIAVVTAWDTPGVWGFFAASLITGLARSFIGPSYQSIFSRLVVHAQTSRASAISISVNRFGNILGPVVGGFLIAFSGPLLGYAVAGFGFLVGVVCLFRIRGLTWDRSAVLLKKTRVFHDLTEGLVFVVRHKILFPALALDMFAVLFGGVTAILPVFAKEVLQAGPDDFGKLRAAFSVGALCLSMFLIYRPIQRRVGGVLLGTVFGFGVATLGLVFSQTLVTAGLCLALAGACDSVSMVIRGAIVQIFSPDLLRGRVAAVNSIFIGSSNELGALESGFAASVMGLLPSIAFGGIMTLLCVFSVTAWFPELRKLDRMTGESK